AAAQHAIAGGGARLEQGLELPGLRPFGVVAAVGAQGPHQRAVLALGAEVGVHLPQRALAGAFRTGASELAGAGGADREDLLLALGVAEALRLGRVLRGGAGFLGGTVR